MCTGGSNPSTSAKQNENVLMLKNEVMVEFDISINHYVIPLPTAFVVKSNLKEGDRFTCELSKDGEIILTRVSQ